MQALRVGLRSRAPQLAQQTLYRGFRASAPAGARPTPAVHLPCGGGRSLRPPAVQQGPALAADAPEGDLAAGQPCSWALCEAERPCCPGEAASARMTSALLPCLLPRHAAFPHSPPLPFPSPSSRQEGPGLSCRALLHHRVEDPRLWRRGAARGDWQGACHR
eukprot:scaffold21336_cov98-Isochrysis_galbana.AAC.4